MSGAGLIVAPHLAVSAIEGRGVIVVDDDEGHTFLAGAACAALVRAAQRSETDDLLAAVAGQVAPDAAREALDELVAAKVLVPGGGEDQQAAWWWRQGVEPGRAARALADARVAIRAVGAVDPDPVAAALTMLGVALADEPGDLDIVLVDDYLDPELERINRLALETGRPWLLAALETAEPWIGPLVLPHRGPCWECLAQRLRHNRAIDDFLREQAGAGAPPARYRGMLPTTRHAAAGLLATHAAKWLAGGAHLGIDTVLSLDTGDWTSASHRVVWRPQCPACGEPDASRDAPALAPRLAAPGSQPAVGGSRTTSPDTTWERHRHHVSRITGIVRAVRPVNDVPWPQQVYVTMEPPIVGPQVRAEWRVPEPWANSGKGTSPEHAHASALCEALERYCGRYAGDEPSRVGTFEGLGDAAIHPNDCLHYSDEQYALREELNRDAESGRSEIPEPFDPEATLEWSPLWSVFEERERLLPASYCYLRAPSSDPVFFANSNGCASGNTLEEAMLHGLLELIERDHAALWWYNRLRLPGIDLDSVQSDWLAEVRRQFAASERELWAIDLTADLGIPVVAAMAPARNDPAVVAVGFGADLDGTRATVRAVTELIQVQWLPAQYPAREVHMIDAAEAPHLRAATDLPPRQAHDLPALRTADLRRDLDACLDALRAAAIDVLVLDQTRPDVGLPVVRMVAPQLRHFWPRFAPGRLYDVPVALGLREQPPAERDLVPIPPGI